MNTPGNEKTRDDCVEKLTGRFRKQQEFTAGYAPLYSRIFGLLADWLTAGQPNPLTVWLLTAAQGRASFDVPLLLLAGLHRAVLAREEWAVGLVRYYPTAGGERGADHPEFADDLRQAILAGRAKLGQFIATATVQTNETARGLCWLWPVAHTGWRAIHLVDLGASAGLNLVADQRRYDLRAQDGGHLLTLGTGSEVQFQVTARNYPEKPPFSCLLPRVISRTGCDLAPFRLQTAQDEQTLASFVWGDQRARMAMLREGIAAFRQAQQGVAPVSLYQADLPDDLGEFLKEQISPLSPEPVVLYNTYLTTYLKDKGKSLRPQIAAWAARQRRPVLWLQWETLWDGLDPPAFGWVGWTADLWSASEYHHWHLAWAHPHGTEIDWLSASADWQVYWNDGK